MLTSSFTSPLATHLTASLLTALGAATLAFGNVSPAMAGSFTYSGSTLGEATWNRPIANGSNSPVALSNLGTSTPFSVQQFTVDTAGDYSFVSAGIEPRGWDNFLVLYRNSFNPEKALENVRIANDDFTSSIGLSGFASVSLRTGVNYFLVTTGFTNNDAGQFLNTIEGPGNISATAIPTPALLPGLLGLGLQAWRKRKTAKSEAA
jgi:hypothetical protein